MWMYPSMVVVRLMLQISLLPVHQDFTYFAQNSIILVMCSVIPTSAALKNYTVSVCCIATLEMFLHNSSVNVLSFH